MTTSKLVLLWLDPSVNADKDNANTQTQLRKIITDVYAFEDVSTCDKYIKNLSEEKQVVLIINGGFGEEFVPKIHEMPSLIAIYIFCMDQAKYVEWAKQFSKIKSVITYLHQLVSIIESDYQNENKAKHLIVSNLSTLGKGEEEDEDYDDRCVFQFDLKDLVEAGELQYNDKTIKLVAIEIIEKFKKDPDKDYNMLLLNALKPVMYLLKREQNLAVFSDQVKSALSKERNIQKLSQRLLIDTLMINSNRFLRQRLMYLLSKRNAVPMTQPSMSTTNQIHRFVSSIIHIWDFNRPILLSFGIGKVKGKSSLLNALFEANFEQSVADIHFRGTIDVDFGYHFSQRRSVNIADIHGDIDGKILEQYSKIFNGFLVHIRSDDANGKIEHIHNILKCLPANSYIRLLIRDVNDENETDVIDTIEKKLSIHSNYHVDYLLELTDKGQLDVRNKIDELRESIFRDADKLTCHTEDYIQCQLKQQMNNGQLKNIQHDENFLKEIQPVLIAGTDRLYPLYNLFKRMCEIKAEIAKIDPYQANFRNDELFKKQHELFEISAEFKKKQANREEAGQAFELFFQLLEKSQDRSNNLYFLSNELRRSQIKSSQQQRLISLEIHWRNAIISSACLPDTQKKLLIDAYFQYMCEGYPFEIIDGDNFEMQYEFLAKCFKLFQSKRIFVISVIGQQNSGKSTLLNFLFGTLFEVREGRCTKGIYGTLINVTSKIRENKLVPPDYDYILAIDTEGILSLEKGDEQYGKRLVLFCLAVSHLVLFNISGQITDTIEKLFLLCTQSLNHIGTTRVTKPLVRFILNQQNNPNKQDVENQLRILGEDLKKNNLTDLIDLGPDSFYILSIAFTRKPFEDPICKDAAALLTEPTFVTDVQKLCQTLVDCSSEIIRRVGYNFSVPTQWLDIAQNTLEVIKKYPDLTYFKEVFEREQYKKVREYIRTKFKDFLSQDYATNLIQQGKESSHSDSIKSLFESEKTKSLDVLKENLEEYIEQNGLNENIRNQSKDFLNAQVASLFRSWQVSATIAATQHKLDQIINHGENQLQELSRIKSTQNRQVDRTTAINEFDAMWKDKFEDIEKQFDSESLWKQSIESAYCLYDILDGEALPSINDLFSHLDFLKKLSTTDQVAAMNKISDRFAVKAAEIDPFITKAVDKFKQISYNQLLQSYTFFNCEELKKIYSDYTVVSNSRKREDIRKQYSKNLSISSEIASKLGSNVCFSVCFKKLSTQIAGKFDSQNNVENPVEISLLQAVSGEVHSLVETMNEEFSNFNLRVSKAFRGVLHTCAVMFIAQFYYNRHKKYFDDAISKMNSKKVHLRDRYIRMVVVEDNDDENIAMALVKEYCQASLESFKSTVNTIIRQEIENKSQDLNRYLIIQKLAENISAANDDWLMKYVFNIQDLIIAYFNQCWDEINSTVDQHLQNIKNNHLQLCIEFSRLTERMNIVLKHSNNHSLTFIDDLFKLPDGDTSCKLFEKKDCMAILLFKYFTNEQTDLTKITTNSGTSYIVDPLWAKIVNELQAPSVQLKTIFLTMKSTFESCNISYLHILLQKTIKEKERIEKEFRERMNAFVELNISNLKELWLKRVRGCEMACPCCKRLCDVDHYLDNTSSIGAGDNRHRCQSGHQLRGMGGIRYETSNEASLEYCENIKDDDPIVNKSGKRITWKEFKDIYSTWDFGDPRNRGNHETPYALIWNRIGEQICQQHSEDIIFVTKNSPIPYNHFILVLDHSGSMESKVENSDMTAWKHLLKAVEQFISVRNNKISRTDRMTVIIFGSRAIRAYNREKLNQIDINRIDMMKCGSNTNFRAAFQLIIDTLDEIQNQNNTVQDSIRQTIVFMTDGQPYSYPTNELDRLSTSYGHMINNFWTLGLGNINQEILNKINKTMKGTFMNIEHPAELPNAYAEIADF